MDGWLPQRAAGRRAPAKAPMVATGSPQGRKPGSQARVATKGREKGGASKYRQEPNARCSEAASARRRILTSGPIICVVKRATRTDLILVHPNSGKTEVRLADGGGANRPQ